MNVLITGGAGYIGSHCNRCFSKHGVDTVVLDDLSDGHKEAVIAGKFVEGDFGDVNLLEKLFKQYSFDGIVHFAAFADVADSVIRPQRYYENNVNKFLNLIDTAVKYGIKYVVFSSSAATFGEPQYIPIDEKHPQAPINPYGTTKLIGEKILADYEQAYGLHSCSFRYFNASGASRDHAIGEGHNPEHHLIPLVIKAVLEKKKIKVFGNDYSTRDGSCIRDYVHVEDLAEAHYLGLKYIMDNNVSEQFNLGSGNGFSVMEIINAIEQITGEKVSYEIEKRRQGDPAILIAANDKAKTVLGWNPHLSTIDRIVSDALQWEKNRKY